MINFYFADLAKLIMALILSFFPSSGKTPVTDAALLNVGKAINDMILTKGAAGAQPLWLYCSSAVNNNLTTGDCQVPQVPALAIGHAFLPTDDVFHEIKWSDLQWRLSIDDRLINLAAFGTYNYILPAMTPNPSLVREVFLKFKAWDIVLTDLQPGAHTLKGEVRSGTEAYKWVVNLIIEDKSTTSRQN